MNNLSTITDFEMIFHAIPGMVILLFPNPPQFTILDASDRFLEWICLDRKNVRGMDLFDVLPDDPANIEATGKINFTSSLLKVIETRKPHKPEIQRYDMMNKDGIFEKFNWAPCNTPVLNDKGEVIYIIHTTGNLTDRVHTENFEKTTQENFEVFLNNANAPFAILTGSDFIFTYANSAYIKLMNGRQLLNKPLSEAVPELQGQPFMVLLEQVYNTGIPFHAAEIPAEAIFDGDTELSTRYFNLSYTPFKNDSGLISGVLASGYDITENVEMRRSEKRQILNRQAHDLFMQAPVGFVLLTGENHLVELANAEAIRLTGKGAEFIGKPLIDSFPELEKQGYIGMLDEVLHKGKTFHLKERAITFSNKGADETLYMDLVYQPYREGDDIVGVLSLATDVTSQVMFRKEVEEIKERFEMMANNIPNLAWIADTKGYIFWYNKRWYEYTGKTPEEMQGWGWKSVHDQAILPNVLERWQASISSGKPFEMVFPLKGADDTFRQFLTRVNPVFDSDGNLIRWLGTNTDITKQKELERMKDDFLSITSHELRTPVTTIKAYGQIAEKLLADNGDDRTLAIVQKMSSQVNKLTSLIEDLLDTTKIHQGRLVFKNSSFDFSDLVNEVVDDMQKTNPSHVIKSVLIDSIIIYGDRDKLGQVLINIMSNAIKYSPGAGHILINTIMANDGIQVSVQDFGIGISKTEQEKIFGQFYRVSEGNLQTFPGMGIGLYISSEIIKLHKGRIWIESVPGQGSTFYVWLPLDYQVKVAL